MKNNNCTSETLSKYFLSSLFGLFALGLVVMGVTFLPGIGLLLAVPVVAIAFVLIRTKLDDQCRMDFNKDIS